MGPTLAITVTTPEAARRAVDSLKTAGADFIKVRDFLPCEAYFAAPAEARRLAIPLVGHTQGARVTEIEFADGGQLSVEHLTDLVSCRVRPDDSLSDEIKERKCQEVAAAFARNGTWFTPTLRVSDHPDPARVIDLMRRAGARLLAGSDITPGVLQMGVLWMVEGSTRVAKPGASLHDELVLLTKAGLTLVEALRRATLNPAEFLHATDSLGPVAPGKLADLVRLDVDPFVDMSNTRRIRAVVADGRYYDRAALDEVLAGTEQAASKFDNNQPVAKP